MLAVSRDDDALGALLGVEVRSGVLPHVTYRPLKLLGTGGTANAFLALRRAPDGECPVVLKVLRPRLVMQLGEKALLVVRKEAVSLGRLNERTPPAPFVVRLIEADFLPIDFGGKPMNLAWLAVEYVYGGLEGTTLADRVDRCKADTSFAFDPRRAARAIECMCAGLDAVHEVGIIHRDMKPENVLCCGSGEEEVLKIADFGIARPAGVAATFGLVVGTPGFAAPEMAGLDPHAIGAWSDVFGLACTAFTVLTGEELFQFSSPMEAFALARAPERRSILDCKALSPELRARPEVCRAIDAAFARATAPQHTARTASAGDFAEEMLPHLRAEPRRTPLSARSPDSLSEAATIPGAWTWTWLHRSGLGPRVRDAAWSSDGRCLAATEEGLAFWDGTAWREVATGALPRPAGLRFVRVLGPGRWLIGGDGGTFARYTSRGIDQVVTGDPGTRFELFSGDLEDLAVFVGAAAGAAPTLFALLGRRWTRPLPVREVAAMTGLAAVEDARWLLVGPRFAAIYAPLDREVQRIGGDAVPDLRCAAGRVDLRTAVAGGAGGSLLTWTAGDVRRDTLTGSGNLDVSAVAVDSSGRAWAAGTGRAWISLNAGAGERWKQVWEDGAVQSPAVALWADVGIARVVLADGAVLEARAGLSGA